jgi:hypothetical protein
MRIKTNNCCTVLLANYSAKVFKKAEYIVAVTKQKLLGPLAGVCSVAFTIAYVVCLLECCCLAVLYKLYYIETLTLLTLTAPHFSKLINKTFSVAA